MADVIRVLIVEDLPTDAELNEREVLRVLPESEFLRVETREDFLTALESFRPDIILSDYKLPHFDGMLVLKLARERAPGVPFILITGSINEETAVDCMKAGAWDYVLKEYIKRLGPAVLTVLEQKRLRREKRLAEELTARIAREWHETFNAITDAVCLFDTNGRILRYNAAFKALADREDEEITGCLCHEVMHGTSDFIDNCPTPRAIKSRQRETLELESGGRYFQVSVDPVLDETGAIVSLVHIMRDITEHHKLEAQYLQAQKMESIGTLAGGVAHDFNNILTAIIGYGHVALMKMAGDDPQRLNIENMLEGADRAAHLTKDLLLFSRKQVSERKPVDLNAVIRKVEKFLTQVIGEDIECKTMLRDQPIPVHADSHQLEQVLMNLATNGRDAMPKGGTFTVTTEQIELTGDFIAAHGYGKTGAYAMITISDTGTGMVEATRKRIYEPFFTTKEVGKGTGLGLAVVYGIIKQHEGFINLYSEPGKGATFRIYLPIIGSIGREETAARQEKAPARGTETVLVAEDDDALRKLSRTILTQYGYKVIAAVDGEDAVSKFRENKDAIQLLLFDLIMPKMNGNEAYDEIRKIQPDMKVIFASGYAPDIIRQKTPLGEGVHLIYKPMSPMALLRKVRSVLDGAK